MEGYFVSSPNEKDLRDLCSVDSVVRQIKTELYNSKWYVGCFSFSEGPGCVVQNMALWISGKKISEDIFNQNLALSAKKIKLSAGQ